MTEYDTVQRFLLDEANIRGQIVRLSESYTTIIKQHAYPNPIAKLVGDTLLSAVLLTSIIKFTGQLTIQFQSDGPVKLLLAKCNHLLQVRALAQWDQHTNIAGLSDMLGAGQLIVTIEHDQKIKPFQSIIPIHNNSLNLTLEQYFLQSEQLPTKIYLATDNAHASGLLLQVMPDNQPSQQQEYWQHITTLSNTITACELLQLPNHTILHRLYHQEKCHIFPTQTVEFACTCSPQKMESMLRSIGKTEVLEMLTKDKSIVVTCEFCNFEYAYFPGDIEQIFSKSN